MSRRRKLVLLGVLMTLAWAIVIVSLGAILWALRTTPEAVAALALGAALVLITRRCLAETEDACWTEDEL